jgi:hypothetical protein
MPRDGYISERSTAREDHYERVFTLYWRKRKALNN